MSDDGTGMVRVEATGETVGEAKWAALKQLEQLVPNLDRESVEFQVVTEGERGLLGVGYTPAHVVASAAAGARGDDPLAEPGAGGAAREFVERVAQVIGASVTTTVSDRSGTVTVTCSGPDLGLLIGKHGQTIDSLQFICSQAAFRGYETRKRVTIDAGGYRERREAMLQRQADRGASDALRYGRPVELDSMAAAERKIVHLYLQDRPEVETHSEGDEPFRRIVISPIRTG